MESAIFLEFSGLLVERKKTHSSNQLGLAANKSIRISTVEISSLSGALQRRPCTNL